MTDHQSSWISRAQTRMIVAIEQRLGLEPKKAKIFVMAIAVLLVFTLSLGLYLTTMDGSGEYSSAVVLSKESKTNSNLFADDGGDDEESGGGGSDGESEDEDEGGGSSKRQSRGDEGEEDDVMKPKQLKLFQDKDKTLMKFFTKHRKDSEVAAHFQLLEDTYKDLKAMKTIVLGQNSEKKSIIAYAIGRGKSGKGLLVVANERSDEWTGSMALAYFATRLLQKYALTPSVTKVMNSLTLLLIPVLKPADKKHGDVSKDFASFSQTETQLLKTLAKKEVKKLFAFANVKCCGGMVSMPKPVLCPRADEQKSVVDRIAVAMSKFSSFKYSKSFAEQDTSISPVFAANELGISLAVTLDAHPASGVSSASDVKSSDILGASQNITMGLLEMCKYLAVDWNKKSSAVLGGGGGKACGGGKKSGGGDDEEGDEESEQEAGEEEDAGDDSSSGGSGDGDGEEEGEEESSSRHSSKKALRDDDEEDSKDSSSSSSSSSDESGKDQAQSFDNAKESVLVEGAGSDEFEFSVKYAKAEGVRRPRPEVDFPTDDAGDTFLYFAYGPDMLFDVLLRAGITSAWKVVNARLPGYTFDYTYHSSKKWKSGIADIVKSSHGTVYGVIWRVDKTQLPLLLTWQSASAPASPLTRKYVEVQDLEGRVYKCLTFYVVKKMKGEDVMGKYHRFSPSRQYRNCILKGAKANHLPFNYIEHKLKSHSLAPLFTDKVGSSGHRNSLIGPVCDPELPLIP